MKQIVIQGGNRLFGTIDISGSKNASLPILAATLLIDEKIILKNIPDVKDISTMISLLESIGKKIEFPNSRNEIIITSKINKRLIAPYKLVKTMRAGVLVLGPLLAKYGQAKVSLPGGCAIGSRPVDLHIDLLKKMGAKIKIDKGYIVAKVSKKLKPNKLKFQSISVGATENLIMAATLCEGTTVIKNIAIEPEILDLINFLNKSGAKIVFNSKRTIAIKGVKSLKGTTYSIIPDRIEAGTYAAASLISNGKITLNRINTKAMKNIFDVLQFSGATLNFNKKNSVTVSRKKIKSINVKTLPYPGFPTDMQAQLMSLLCLANGKSIIKEDIFENRFLHVSELKRMGADIKIKNKRAYIQGIKNFTGAEVMATDLRASVSLVLAGLAAKGTTIVNRIYHLERGYGDLVKKLKKCGASIILKNV
jgi:UDP-N-acetylglucosamine 1-carboxyvinyltransferase